MTKEDAAEELNAMLDQFRWMKFARDPHHALRPLPPDVASPARIMAAVEARLTNMDLRGLSAEDQSELRSLALRMVQLIEADVYPNG